MLHNQVATNVSRAIQAKGTTKSNAELNFFSTIGVIQPSNPFYGCDGPPFIEQWITTMANQSLCTV